MKMRNYRLLNCIWLLLGLFLTACSDGTLGLERVDLGTRTSRIGTPNSKNTTPTIGADLSPYSFSIVGSPTKSSSGVVVIDFDPSKTGGAISPYIYGLAGSDESDPNYDANLRPTLSRWGGNPATRYNWVLGNAWNAARDWEFRNTDYGQSGNVALGSVTSVLKQGQAMLLTIPTIGWVAKNTDQNTRSLDVPLQGGPPLASDSEAIVGYNPEANRALTSVQSKARKNAPFVTNPDPNSPIVYQDEWVASLVKQFGPANAGGVKFYAMDNEPELWSQTHTDIHPVRMGYDALLAQFTEYAAAVKDVDPSAEITGPVSWGWTGYLYSELDRGSDNFRTLADRRKHNNLAFLAWFLDQMRLYEEQNNKRLLDVLDVHYYPQATGVFDDKNGSKTDPYTSAVRLRATRSLWDDNYVDESWIGLQIRLIPRLREWINSYYPNTKIGISEWNFGADDTLNGALAISTVLGIFGREGVYLASYWRFPPSESPGFYAFKMYTNFDNKGSTFGDTTIPLKNSDDRRVSSFAALDSKSGRVRLILINNQPDNEESVKVQLPKNLPNQTANIYQLSAQTGNKLVSQPALPLSDTDKIELVLPAYSAVLIDLQP
ncbi:MAG: glycoside hydrolase family 44 protein [Chloroflexota bacterium]|nr:hypothetical protein [Chloroflexota bacterium]